jgi:uncharacterized protein (TIGR03437 family)
LATPLAPSSAATVFADGLAGASVSITDQAGVTRAASMTGSTASQVNFLLPAQLAPGPAIITVTPQTGAAVRALTTIAPVSPAVFQLDAAGLAAANVIRVGADGTQTVEPVTGGISFGAASNRIYLSIYGSGMRGASRVTATIRGREIPVLFAGAQGIEGLDQVNIGPLPRAFAGRGRLTIVIVADGLTANPVQVMFP